MYEIRSLSAVWNQHEVLNVINPKEDTRWRVMPYAFGDYILTCGEITCQSFGLDRKKTVRKRSFFLAPPAGLEPATSWLTVMRSANWAKEEYLICACCRLTVMLTPENIVALFASIHSASRLLIFATSRLKTTLSCFARSSANWAKEEYIKGILNVSLVSAMTYFSGPSPAKYFRHCKA